MVHLGLENQSTRARPDRTSCVSPIGHRSQRIGKPSPEMTKLPVSAGIYSTSTGQLLIYSENELAAEWERVKNLHVNDLANGIADFR